MLVIWDIDFTAPQKSSNSRDNLASFLAHKSEALILSDEAKVLVNIDFEKLELPDDIYNYDMKILNACKRVLSHKTNGVRKIPLDLQNRYHSALSDVSSCYAREIKKTGFDYVHIEPKFNRMVESKIEAISYSKQFDTNYDSLLNTIEEGFSCKEMDAICAEIEMFMDSNRTYKSQVLCNAETKQGGLPFVNTLCIAEENKDFCDSLMSDLGFDFTRGGTYNDTFPSSTMFSPNDVRVTNDFNKSIIKLIKPIMHECGHALYMQNIPDSLSEHMLCQSPSLSMEECIAKIFENHICNSKGFLLFLTRKLRHKFPDFDWDSVDLNSIITSPNKSMIRTESDLLSFNSHILIRYEIERDIINLSLSTKDAAIEWNKRYETWFGSAPKLDQEGILQDPHWFYGQFGYFPMYILASVYSAQIFNCIQRDVASLEHDISVGNFSYLLAWLRENIFQYGSIYTSKDLIRRISGEDLSLKYYFDFLRKSCLE